MINGFLLYLSATQRTFDFSSNVQSDLRLKIKESDFLITDENGTQRIIGLKYNGKTDSAPIVTLICMRHEIAVAKQLAFELKKKFFYSTNLSARLIRYPVGSKLRYRDCKTVAVLYAEFYKPKIQKPNNICILKNGEIYIKGQKLPSYFKLSYLVDILGKPDKTETPEENKRKLLIYSWNDFGVQAFSYYGHKGYVGFIEIYAKETIHVPNPAIVDIYLGKTKIEQAEPGEGYYKKGKHFVAIRCFNKNHDLNCHKGEIAIVQIVYGMYPNEFLIAANRGDKETILSLIKQGRNINRRSGPLFETPLQLAVRMNKLEIAELLLANGADPDIPDVYGKTSREKIKDHCGGIL